MLRKPLSMIFLSIPFALTAPAANAADRAEPQATTAGGTEIKARTSTTKFLQPLCPRLSDGTRCPPIISNGQVAGGGISNIDPAFQADLPNVRVSLFMQEIKNEVIANGGVDGGPPQPFVTWMTTGMEADVEDGGPVGWWLPEPGQPPYKFDGDDGMIYDALVYNACGSFSSFPVTHESTVANGIVPGTGSFEGTDDSTIDSTGFYNLNYTIRTLASDGGVSDFHFRGKVKVTCSGLNALP